MKTVVQLKTFPSVYTDNLQQKLQENEEFCKQFRQDAFCIEDERKAFENEKPYPPKWNIIGRILYWARFNTYLIRKRPLDQKKAVVNIQYVDPMYLFLLPYLKKQFNRIVLTLWGSDLLRQSKLRLKLLTVLFAAADYITVETDEMAAIFREKIGRKFDHKIRKVNFGSSVMECQNKLTENAVAAFADKYGINREKKSLVIGYNRHAAQRHCEVLESLLQSEICKDDFFVIIPWTYGPENKEYRERLETLLRGNFEYAFLETFLEREEIACLRACTDVLFQVQVTDSLSASMLETLYGEKEVITGSWLPYKELVDAGMTMTFVDQVNDTGKALENITQKPTTEEKLAKNKEIIWNRYSWEANLNKWISLYQ